MPILYFGGGEGETIIDKYNLGWVAEAGNYLELNSKINDINKEKLDLNFKKNIQKTALQNFDFQKQLSVFLKQI